MEINGLNFEHVEGSIYNLHLNQDQIEMLSAMFGAGLMPLIDKDNKNEQEAALADEMHRILVVLNRATQIVITAEDRM